MLAGNFLSNEDWHRHNAERLQKLLDKYAALLVCAKEFVDMDTDFVQEVEKALKEGGYNR